ncbi:MAG: type IV pilus secretin PilQ [candidate division NC10 bacterium]|nr:type IV pilus secretin PilQ [candidate division NC10 bacterium]
MDAWCSARLIWRGALLAAVALLIGAGVADAGQVPAAQPSPPAPPAPGPVEVTGVEVQDAGPGALRVLVTADGPIPTYESFTLSDPPRLILDIPNALHAIPQPISARPPAVTAVRSSQYRERPVRIVRIVLDLGAVLPYQVLAVGNQLRVEMGSGVSTAPLAQVSPAPPAPPAPPVPRPEVGPAGRVTRVDLQRVRGRYQIVIRTSGKLPYQISEGQNPLTLSVDIQGATVDPAAARSVDLRQVAAPLDRLKATQLRGDPDRVVRVTASLRGPTRYDVRQTASGIVVDFLEAPRPAVAAAKPPAAEPKPPAAEARPAGAAAAPPGPPPAPGAPARLSMDFKDADVKNLLRIIAEVSGMNVVAGADVGGRVTVRLVNVDWQQALDVILKINEMGYEIDGNVIRVARLTRLEAERKARDDAKKREEEARLAAARAKETEKRVEVQLAPLKIEIVPVNYAKAAEVVKNLDRLKTQGRTDVSIVVDDRTNKLIINETEDTLVRMRNLLKELDRPTPQVLIEARLVEATRTFAQSLGVEWGFAARAFNNSGAAGKNLTPISVFSGGGGVSIGPAPAGGIGAAVPVAISLPATSPTASVGILMGSIADNLGLAVRLSAGESEQKLRTLSAPKVATLDNQEAEIKQGTQVPYTTVDSSGRTVVAFQEAFIKLRVTPHITNDRRVSMKVEAERSSPGDRIDYAGGFAFPVNTRKATTNVLVTNGSTIVIGGLLQSEDRSSETRVPWISNIPVIGALFKSVGTGPQQKIELLIFLTPTILEEQKVS